MPLGTVFGQTAITLAFSGTQHESTVAAVREITVEVGGHTIIPADGIPVLTPITSRVVAVEVDVYQDLTAAALWRYLRETATTTGTLTVGGTSSLTESATNPELVYTVTGWVRPKLDYAQGSVNPVTCTFHVSGNPTVDVV